MDMGVIFEVFTKGMQARTDSGDEVTLVKPGEDRFGRGFEKEFK